MKGLEGKKKEQAERLGMGLGIRRYEDGDIKTGHRGADLRISFLYLCFLLSLSPGFLLFSVVECLTL